VSLRSGVIAGIVVAIALLGALAANGAALSSKSRREYEARFAQIKVDPERRQEAEKTITQIMKARGRYERVGSETGVPWFVVGVIHHMECDGDFRCHLHNGDRLTARTVHRPKGRPITGHPPFEWEESAIDAMRHEGLAGWSDWSIAGTLFIIEKYDGFGYRAFGIPTPYLYAATQFYRAGKFTSDHRFSRRVISKQVGAAAILRRMADQALIEFDSAAGLGIPHGVAEALKGVGELGAIVRCHESSDWRPESLKGAHQRLPESTRVLSAQLCRFDRSASWGVAHRQNYTGAAH
jgi:lysozyme family protein